MKRVCQLVLFVAALSLPTVCETRPDQLGYGVLGEGTASCGEWTKVRAEKNSSSAFVSGAWVQGYLTAFNLYGPASNDITKGTDAEGVMAWVDNYCVQHPLDDLSTAADNLVVELSKRAVSISAPNTLGVLQCQATDAVAVQNGTLEKLSERNVCAH